MADYSNENLELIVRYDGSKTSFESSAEKAAYIAAKISKVVFITGSTATTATASDKTQHIWVSNGSTHKYLDMTNIDDVKNGLTHIAGFAIEGEVKSGSGANGINFKGINGIQIKLNPELSTDNNGVAYWTIEVNGETLYDALNGVGERVDALEESVETLEGNVNTLIGEDTDSSVRDIALDEAGKVQNALIGGDADDAQSSTIAGAKKYAEEQAAAAKGAAVLELKAYVDPKFEGKADLEDGKIKESQLPDYIFGQMLYGGVVNSGNATQIVVAVSEAFKDRYNITTNSVTIPKTDASNYEGTYFIVSANAGNVLGLDTTTGDWIVSNGTAIWQKIDNTDAVASVAGLTGTITASVLAQKLADTGDTNELALKLELTWDNVKPSDGVVYDDLASGVQSSLDLANSAIQGVAEPELGDYIRLTQQAKAIGVEYTTAAITNENATTDGLATVADIRAYLAARLSVKVVS